VATVSYHSRSSRSRFLWQVACKGGFVRDRPWSSAGVSKARWEQARRAVIDRIADAVWRARGRPRSDVTSRVQEPMARLAQIAQGDPEGVRYGLDLVDRLDDEA
jgi:hypothetical protein